MRISAYPYWFPHVGNKVRGEYLPMAVSTRAVALPERVSFARIPDIRPMPGLIQIQLDSFEWFKKEGLRELFEEISPIEDFTGKNLSLEFIVPGEPFGKPKYSEDDCRDPTPRMPPR